MVTGTEFGLLGPLRVCRGGAEITVAAGKQRALLAALLFNSGRVVPAEELAGVLWGAAPPRSAPASLHNHVTRLRRALGDEGYQRISTRSGGYLISTGPGELDVQVFGSLMATARGQAQAGAWEAAAAGLAHALALWRGEPLADVGCDELAVREVPRLAEMRLQALEARIDADLHLGRQAQVIAELQGLVSAHPLRERLHGLLMLALHRDGRQGEALAAYQQARRVLIEELGTEPGHTLHDLHQQILTGDPALGPARDPGPAATVPAVPAPAPAAEVDVRFSLPPDSAAFTGRQAELDRITAAVAEAARAGGVVAIHAIGGMPGIGKTALAVHAAHVLRSQFPDRCLFIDLHAHTPGHDPVPPETALAGLLAAAGVPAHQLPGDVESRAALWRDKMAGKQGLLVLDNAAGSRQVVPLLPGGDTLVLVTSRRHLGDLPGAVVPLLLQAFPAEEARQMFTRLAPRAATDPGAAVAELLGLAGYLPLAVVLLARLYARHPSWKLADLVTETKGSLLAVAAENDTIAAAFELSYRYLDPAGQRFFALLGLHPGGTADPYAAAALTGTSLADATVMLDRLHAEGLLTETGYRRYGMHDLLRRYAREHAAALGADDAEQAVGRLLDYYTRTAARADAWLARQTRPAPTPATSQAGSPDGPGLADAGQALAWARAERASLLACLDHATGEHQHARVTALTAALAELLRRDGPWTDAVTRHTTALHSARHLGDQPALASTLHNLGIVRYLTGDYPGAAQDLEQALTIYHNLGDRLGQANTLNNLANTRQLTGDYPGAAQDLEQALTIYHNLGDRLGQANTLYCLGTVRWLTSDYPDAARDLEQALAVFRDLGDRLGEATALRGLGIVQRLTGDYPGAARDHEQALSIYRDLGDWLGQATALRDLGTVRQLTGDHPGAAQDLEQALTIYRDLGDRLGQANTLRSLGTVGRLTGDYPSAARDLEQALTIYRDLGDRGGEAEALNDTGTLYRLRGEPAKARAHHQQALQLARAIGSAWDEAHALAGLGRCASAAGDLTTARAHLGQAAGIFQRIGAAEATAVTAELAALTTADPATQKPCTTQRI